ncbi:probable U3 small nucleolar RNA-associated protein 11 [Mya arenaria]|uniref:probable U3 small nucleolar RNA-associated protein 11 n=1 Tax=Mya arenaria TaxID=6604 RepID=UPI0022E3F982|nr:probable U3 small nucleolar RNA-associated protein 11 [Mya arenaria]
MSSWKNANKTRARSHRERSQLESRAHLGALEKKKDYKVRALDYQKKQNTLKVLQRRALDKNPDEFYFNMVKTEKKDGVHQLRESTEPEHTEEQLKLMCTQDERYVNMKRSSELKKIEKLKASLHMIDSNSTVQNKHTIFVDGKRQAKKFDAAKYFNTHPALVGRKHNRPTLEALQRGDFANLDDPEIASGAAKRAKKYEELKKRIERERQLSIVAQKMERKKHLMKDKDVKRELVTEETKDAPSQYMWQFKRKR